MRASECCIIRASVAAVVGALVALALLWERGFLVALLMSPLFGSASAVAAATLFWLASLVIPCPPEGGSTRTLTPLAPSGSGPDRD